jgi:hypothetical protein
VGIEVMSKRGSRFAPWRVAVGVGIPTLIALICAGAAPARTHSTQAWAGYQANHDTFRYVGASWTVPTITCPGVSRGASAVNDESYFWVGFGLSASNVMGLGVREFCTGTVATYTSYVYKQSLYGVELPVAPGDKVTAQGSYASGAYSFSFRDQTHPSSSWHSRYRCAFTYGLGCSRAGADVLAGVWAPGFGQSLTDYGSVGFHDIAIIDSRGRHGSLARNHLWKTIELDEYHGATRAASSTPLSHHGTQFADFWRHS